MSRWISKKTFPIRSVLCSSKQISSTLYMTNMRVIPRYLQTPQQQDLPGPGQCSQKNGPLRGKSKMFPLEGWLWMAAIYLSWWKKNELYRNHLIGKFQLTFHVYFCLVLTCRSVGALLHHSIWPKKIVPTQRPQRTATHVHL